MNSLLPEDIKRELSQYTQREKFKRVEEELLDKMEPVRIFSALLII
jgi:hypothetical protein